MTAKTRTIRRAAAAAVALAGILHLVLVPEYLAELPWLGVSFLVAAAGTGWAAYRLWGRDNSAAWAVGGVLSAGMVVGFLVSRTVGLFGYLSPDVAEGIPALVVELAFLGLFVYRTVTATRPVGARRF